jgi:Asp-tRNA(Asn)/Glu-tRNA(Gln) amidotransferase A subunit family amidase
MFARRCANPLIQRGNTAPTPRRAGWWYALALGLLGPVAGTQGAEALAAQDRSTAEGAGFTYLEATIADVHAALQNGSASCVEITAGYLQRIDAYDQSSGLNAVIFSNPAALQKARDIDTRLAAGEALGPLYCVSVLFKDNFDTQDMPTSGGSIALKDSRPPDDAFMVRKLREADAIVIAKTNMAEWAFSPKQTISSSYGRTANAYALDYVPAGSSGGTASATAASFGIVGMGTDTGNSIRGPSSHLALFGIRSTLGLTSRDGVIPLAFDRDIAGPMTRTVEDAARVFNVIAGYDPADAFTELGKGRREDDYTRFLDPLALQGKRIGVLRALVDTPDADPEVIKVFEKALADLARQGAVIVDPFAVDNFAEHLEGDYFCARFRYDMQVYLTSLGAAAPIRDVMEVRARGDYSPYIESRLDYFGNYPADIAPAELDPPCAEFPHHPGRQAYLEDVLTAMDEAEVDAVVYPSWTNPPARLDKAIEDYRGDNSQLVAPATGLPAVTVPMGYSYGRFPAGLQILGRPYSEGLLFGLAYAYEQATRHRRPPEGFPGLQTAPAR